MICRKNIFIGRGQYGWLYFAFLSLIYLIVFGKVVQNSRARCLFFLFLNFSMPMDNQINQYKTKQKQFIELQARLEKSLGQKHLLLFIKAWHRLIGICRAFGHYCMTHFYLWDRSEVTEEKIVKCMRNHKFRVLIFWYSLYFFLSLPIRPTGKSASCSNAQTTYVYQSNDGEP